MAIYNINGTDIDEKGIDGIELTNEDLNIVKTIGFYYAGGNNTCDNKPSVIKNFSLIVEKYALNDNMVIQTIRDDKIMYTRMCNDKGIWTSWGLSPNLTGEDLPPLDLNTLHQMSYVFNSYVGKGFSYGNGGITAGDGKIKANTFFDVNDGVAIGTTSKAMDCSSLVHAIIMGIPYEASKYCGRNDLAIGYAGYGMTLDDYSTTAGRENVRLAANLAKWCFSNGYAYYPNDNYTNVMPGDILFFSDLSDKNGRFMDISHVEFCMGRPLSDGTSNVNTYSYFTCVNCDSVETYSGSKSTVNSAISAKRRGISGLKDTGGTLVLCARLPLKATKINKVKTIINCTTNSTSETIFEGFSLDPNKLYTIIYTAKISSTSVGTKIKTKNTGDSNLIEFPASETMHSSGDASSFKKYTFITNLLNSSSSNFRVNKVEKISFIFTSTTGTPEWSSFKMYEGYYADNNMSDNSVELKSYNLNNLTAAGFYHARGENGCTNLPSDVGTGSFGLVVIRKAYGNYYTQLLYNANKTYRRTCSNGTWGAWSEDKYTDTTYSDATTSASGLLNSTDKTKLNNLNISNTELYIGTLVDGSPNPGVKITSAGNIRASNDVYMDKSLYIAKNINIGSTGSDEAKEIKFLNSATNLATITLNEDATNTAASIFRQLDISKIAIGQGNIGSSSEPVYISNGKFVKCTNLPTGGGSSYTLPTAGQNTLGGVKTTSTVTATTGLTATPIISGVPYYKDTVYTHPTFTSKSSGLYKITVNNQGHVSAATAVTKSDITGLGIASTDNATTSTAGLMSATDKTNLNNMKTRLDSLFYIHKVEITYTKGLAVNSAINGKYAFTPTTGYVPYGIVGWYIADNKINVYRLSYSSDDSGYYINYGISNLGGQTTATTGNDPTIAVNILEIKI